MYCRKIVNLVIHLQTLIESGVPTEDRDDFGDMPIHYAAKSGGFSIITTLVEMGVQPCVAGMFLQRWSFTTDTIIARDTV